jgi:hypothetical protein
VYSEAFSNHGINCDWHARIEELVYRCALFGFEGDLAKAIGGDISGGFCIEEDGHGVT